MMSVNIRLAKLEDHHRCAELLNVLAKATSDSHEIFDVKTFESLISNQRGSLLVALQMTMSSKALMAKMSLLATRAMIL